MFAVWQSVLVSAIFFAAICWGSSIRASDSNTLNKLIQKAGSVLGTALEPLELVVERRMLQNCKHLTCTAAGQTAECFQLEALQLELLK